MATSLPLPLAPPGENLWFWAWSQAHRPLGRPLSESALGVYSAMWQKYLRYVERIEQTPDSVTADQVDAFLQEVSQRQRARYYGLLTKVYLHARLQGFLRGDPPLPERSRPPRRPLPEVLDPVERARVLACLPALEPRDAGLCALLLGTGLRLEEAIRLERPARAEYVQVPVMRGRPSRTIPVAEDCLPAWRDWWSTGVTPVFPSARGGVISTTTAWRIVGRALEGADLRHAGPELLRSTWVVAQLKGGASIEDTVKLAGVKNLDALHPYQALAGIRSRK